MRIFGVAAVCASAVAAGIIASSSGSASVTPAPLQHGPAGQMSLRQEHGQSFLATSASADAAWRRQPRRCRPPACGTHRSTRCRTRWPTAGSPVPRPGERRRAPAACRSTSSSRPTRVHHELFGERPHEQIPAAEERLAQLGPGRRPPARSAAPSWHRSAPWLPDPRRAIGRWRRSSPARGRSDRSRRGTGCSPASSDDFRAAPAASSALRLWACERSVSTSGGGGVGGVPISLPMTQAPRSTGDVRSPYDVRSSTAPLPSRPQRRESSSVTRRNCGPSTDVMP